MSEVGSMASRHRRKSVPSFSGGFRSKGGGGREGSVDPLLDGFQSDGGESVATFHRYNKDSKHWFSCKVTRFLENIWILYHILYLSTDCN